MLWAYQNGKWVKQNEAVVPLQDAGFLFGEAIFETFLVENGEILQFENHFKRLQKSLSILKISGLEKSKILEILKSGVQKNGQKNIAIRLTITRGLVEGMAVVGEPSIYVNFREVTKYSNQPLKIMFLSEKDFPVSRTTQTVKSSNYFWNRLAVRHCQERGCFGPIFVTEEKIITEGSTFNVFFVKNGEIHTPSLDEGILPGVTRQHIIKVAKSLGISVFERKIYQNEIEKMDEAFITATTMKIQPIFWTGFENQLIITRRLQVAFWAV